MKALTYFNDPVFKPIVVTEKCGVQTVIPDLTTPYTFKALKNGPNDPVLKSALIATDFPTSDPTLCPVLETTLVQSGSDAALDAATLTVLKINGDGMLEIDEANFDGTTISARVRVITEFNVAVYKPISITDRCPS